MQIVNDTSDFEAIFHSYKNRIFSYVLAIVKNRESAEEVTQEILIKLWLCREALDKVEKLDAYIFVIARNKSLNHLRKAAYDVRLLNELKALSPRSIITRKTALPLKITKYYCRMLLTPFLRSVNKFII